MLDVQVNSNSAPGTEFRRLWGIPFAAISYDRAVELIARAIERRIPFAVSAQAVHGLTEALLDATYRKALESIDLLLPDGQPLRHCLNRFYACGLEDRVYGPELMLRICRLCTDRGIPVYFYGGMPEVLPVLMRNLSQRFVGLQIAGEPGHYRPLQAIERAALLERIRAHQSGVVFLGLGCPLQERFAAQLKFEIETVTVCVGAAFDFHSGHKAMAPAWMQRNCLEWLFRLGSEPRRLWRRYLLRNSYFLFRLTLHALGISRATDTTYFASAVAR